jgi:hypothetical protein
VGESLPEPRSSDAGPVARRDMRVSDEDRRAVVDELRTHFGAGRIDLAEFEDRTRAAWDARVRGELEPLLDDLPDLRPPTPGPPVRPRPAPTRPLLGCAAFRIHLYLWVVLSVFWTVIWVATGSEGTFWPLYPIAGVGLTVGIHAAVRKGLT